MRRAVWLVVCTLAVVQTVWAAEYELAVDIDTVFPRLVLTPDGSAASFCQLELRGIFECVPILHYYDPGTDSELADTRVAFDRVDWNVASKQTSFIVTGFPENMFMARAKPSSNTTTTSNETSPSSSSSSAETTNSSSSSSPPAVVVTRVPFKSLKLTATPSSKGAVLSVAVDDYEWASTSENAVLVLEWEVLAGYSIDESMISRNRRTITIGGCTYSANTDATDIDGSVRCEVRAKGNTIGRGAFVYQSYSHFDTDLNHTNAMLSAAVLTPSGNAASAPAVSFALAFLLAAVTIAIF